VLPDLPAKGRFIGLKLVILPLQEILKERRLSGFTSGRGGQTYGYDVNVELTISRPGAYLAEFKNAS
jgi:hypothetical protein